MRGWGFDVSRFNSCMFQHESRQIRCLVDGDDFVCVGQPEDLKWLKAKLSLRFEIKTSMVGMNAQDGEIREARILNRVIRLTPQGWEYEADQRHADLIIQEMGAADKSTLSRPGGDKKVLEEESNSNGVDRVGGDSV